MFEKEHRDCPRPNCDESLEAYPEVIDLDVEMHLAEDHDPPWDEIGDWPRGDA